MQCNWSHLTFLCCQPDVFQKCFSPFGNLKLSYGRCCFSFIHLAISGGHLPYSGFYLKATFITTFSQLKQFLSLSIFCFALQVLVTLWLLQILFWQVMLSVFGNLLWYSKEVYMYTTCIWYLFLCYKAEWKRWLYLLFMLCVPTLL